jgi:hypothetical protein
MSKRKQLDRERLQVYYANMLMAYRPLIVISGLLLFVFAFLMLTTSPLTGILAGVFAVLVLLLGNIYAVVVFVSSVLAWVVTVGRSDEC